MALDRTIAPPYREIDHIEIAQAKPYVLDNGIPLYIVCAGTERVVRLELVFKAGHWYEPHNGVSYFTTKLLSAGTQKLSAQQIEERIARYGAFLDITPGYDRSSITLYCLSKHLKFLLELLLDMVQESIFPEDEIRNFKKLTLQNHKVNLKKTGYIASQQFRKMLFGENHPYSRNIDEIAIEKTTRKELISFHKGKFSSDSLDIIVSGNADENLFDLINTIFGSGKWGNKDSFENTIEPYSSTQKTLLIEKEDSVQSSIRVGSVLFPLTHPDYFKLNLLIEILGGYFGSRLMANIREDKGFTYGINASFHSFRHAGYLVIGTDVNKENTSQTIEEIIKEIQILKREPVSKEELSIVVNYLLGSFLSSISTPFGLADRFKTIYFNNLGYDFYDRYTESIKNTTPEELMEVGNKYLKEDSLREVVAGGK